MAGYSFTLAGLLRSNMVWIGIILTTHLLLLNVLDFRNEITVARGGLRVDELMGRAIDGSTN